MHPAHPERPTTMESHPPMTLFTSRPAQHAAPYADGPRLLADIGGTNARFALEQAPGRIDTIRVLPTGSYPTLADATVAYLKDAGHPPVRHAVIAIANPVQGDAIHMTNHHWTFSIEAARRQLQLDTLLVVNDFTALAMTLPSLGPAERVQAGGGTACAGGVIGLVGAGTGLGVGGLVPADGGWTALNSEGGHASFAPADARELDVLQYAWTKYPHVSAERLVSGPGIELIYEALIACGRYPKPVPSMPDAAAIGREALQGNDPLCREVIDCFCAMLGTVASNVALTLGASGGMYIGGGIVPRLGECFLRSPFRARFESKGRFSDYLSRIPTYVITAPYPAFAGAAAILASRLDQSTAFGGTV
jgi:glucokinase